MKPSPTPRFKEIAMTAANARFSRYGKFMPYQPPARKSYQRPTAAAAPFKAQPQNPAKPFFVGMAPANRFIGGANPKIRLAGLEKTGPAQSVPAPVLASVAPFTAAPSLKPGELGREQGRIQGLSRSSNPKHRELAKSRYDKLVPTLQGQGTHRADHPANVALTRKLLGSDDKGLGVKRLQAAVVALGKGHYLGNFGQAGIDGKRGYFTEQAVSKVKAELGLKSEGDIIAAARKKLAAHSAHSERKSPAIPVRVKAAQDYSDAIQSMRRAKTRDEFGKARDRAVGLFEATGYNNKALFQLVSQTFGKMTPQALAGESPRKGT
jgi:hypothetical protein